jgi:hypothetical protein
MERAVTEGARGDSSAQLSLTMPGWILDGDVRLEKEPYFKSARVNYGVVQKAVHLGNTVGKAGSFAVV